MREATEKTASRIVKHLERYLNFLLKLKNDTVLSMGIKKVSSTSWHESENGEHSSSFCKFQATIYSTNSSSSCY